MPLPAEQAPAGSPAASGIRGGSAAASTDWEPILGNWVAKKLSEGNIDIQKEAMDAFEFIMIKEALKFTHGKKLEAARILGIGRNTLTRKLQEFRERFKDN